MTDLRWKRWGRRVAGARGISCILTCSPSCGNGGAETHGDDGQALREKAVSAAPHDRRGDRAADALPARALRDPRVERKAGEEDDPPPMHSRALGFDCHFSGTDALLTLRCTRDDKVAEATWGG
jgi:hypothetical protein